MIQDVKKAYFYAAATRDVYVDLPPERAQPGMCAKLNKSLYGTRDAALNWSQAYSEVLEGMGFVKGAVVTMQLLSRVVEDQKCCARR